MRKSGNFKIHRTKKDENFTVVANSLLMDGRLSAKARFVMAVVCSLPDSWNFSMAGMAKITGESTESIRKALAELEKYGYVTKGRERLQGGKLGGSTYEFFETPDSPKLDSPKLDKPNLDKPVMDKPVLDKPNLDKPVLVDSPQSITKDKSRTNIINHQKTGEEDNNHSKVEEDNNNHSKEGLAAFVAQVMSESKATYRINGKNVPKEQVHKRLAALDDDDLTHVAEIAAQNTGTVRNMQGYLLACLYNAAEKAQRPKTAAKRKKSQNYIGREWDYDYLELMERAYVCESVGQAEEAAKWRKKAEEVRKAQGVA